MSTLAAQDLREFETMRTAPMSVMQERRRLRRLRVRRITDDIRARDYLVDADRVAASILDHITLVAR